MTETSTTYRWRPRLKVMWLFLPRIPHVVWAALTVFSLAQQVFWFDLRARRAPPTARAVSAMVREDAREMVALAEKHIPWRFENVARDRVTCESQGITVLRVGDAVFVTARKEGVR